MKHALKNSIEDNMHGLLECTFVDYANQLRANYPSQIIRNAKVFASGVPEFARLGFIELVSPVTRHTFSVRAVAASTERWHSLPRCLCPRPAIESVLSATAKAAAL